MAIGVVLVLIVLLSLAVVLAVALPHVRRGDRLLTADGERRMNAAVLGFKDTLQNSPRPSLSKPEPAEAEEPSVAEPSVAEPSVAEPAAEAPKAAEKPKATTRPTPSGPEAGRPGGRGAPDRNRRGTHKSPVFTGTHTVSAADPLVKWSEKMLGPSSQPFAKIDAQDDSREAGQEPGK